MLTLRSFSLFCVCFFFGEFLIEVQIRLLDFPLQRKNENEDRSPFVVFFILRLSLLGVLDRQ